MIYSNIHNNKITAENDFLTTCALTLRTIVIYTLSLCISLTVLSYKLLMGSIRLFLRYSTKIIFYSILGIALISIALLLSSLYVITLGTLHFP